MSNKDITSKETLQLAVKEAESWTLGQRIPEVEEIERDEPQATASLLSTMIPLQWSCQLDASWVSSNERTGLGFVLLNADVPSLFGAQGYNNAASPLHTEAEGLIWAIQEVIKKGNKEVHFELDCEQLVKLINQEEDWPSMAAELDEIKALSMSYLEISFTHIPRSLNVRADCLAKGGRSHVRNVPYVDCCAPNWLAAHAGRISAF